MGRLPASSSGNRPARIKIRKVAMAYNKKFKPINPEVTNSKRKTKKQNVSVCWRVSDDELKSRFEAACKTNNLREADMLRQMIIYSLDRMAV